jgi:hypothetical protein
VVVVVGVVSVVVSVVVVGSVVVVVVPVPGSVTGAVVVTSVDVSPSALAPPAASPAARPSDSSARIATIRMRVRVTISFLCSRVEVPGVIAAHPRKGRLPAFPAAVSWLG